MTNFNCNKFFAILLLLTVGVRSVGYSDESVFTNNNSITNKLLSVEKFVNNGKFYINLEDGLEFDFFNLKEFVNSGLFELNQDLVIENTVPAEGGNINPVVEPLASFENTVGGRMVVDRTENDFGYIAIVAKDIKNQGTIVATNSNSIILNASISFSLSFFSSKLRVFFSCLKKLNLSFRALFHKILKKLSEEPNFCVGRCHVMSDFKKFSIST